MRLLIFFLLLASAFYVLVEGGTERSIAEGRANSTSGISYTDTLVAGGDTSLIINTRYRYNYWSVTIRDTGASFTDSLKLYTGSIRYSATGAVIDTLWNTRPVELRKYGAWSVLDTTAVGVNATTTHFINAPIFELLKVVLVNQQFITGRKVAIVVTGKREDTRQ
jgi:hypothetical protein